MAKRLTEEMVIARTKISDLAKIKRLNCWGSELVDVSLLRRMPCVEVLSLSINKINSLEDFQWCKRLEELYIRQNDIRSLNQVVYLQLLPNLKNLWLGENPCANEEGYRLAVLRALPQLQKLDNIAVTPEELKEAHRKGKTLSHPDDLIPIDDDVYTGRYEEYTNNEQDYSPQSSPNRPEQEYETEEADEFYSKEELRTDEPPPLHISDEMQRRNESSRRNYSPEQEYTERRRSSYERESPPQQQYYEEYTNGDKHPQQVNNYRQHEPVEVASYQQYEAGQQRRERHACSASYRPPFNRRPVTRNSNILSAVLCLVKELDYPSLEVVEMAVRCRMDELDE